MNEDRTLIIIIFLNVQIVLKITVLKKYFNPDKSTAIVKFEFETSCTKEAVWILPLLRVYHSKQGVNRFTWKQ